MKQRLTLRAAGVVVLALGLLLAGFALGRQTSPSSAPATDKSDRYADGLAVGRAGGLAEGRAIQAGANLPAAGRPNAKTQFQAGYRAGADDVFAGYDGGWFIGRPYVIVLSSGIDGETYRISHREEYVSTAPK